MHREKILEFIGKQKPSSFNGNLNHMSYFIIPFPHAIYDGILNNIYAYPRFRTIDRIDFFLKGMKKNNWKLKNPMDIKDGEKLFGCKDTIKRYIYDDMIPYIDIENTEIKKVFFQERENLLFELECKKSWLFHIDKNEINFIMDGIDLWIMDDHIAFLVLKTKLTPSSLNISQISAMFNRNMREFRKLDINFSQQTISYISNTSENGNLLEVFFEKKLTLDGHNLLNITANDLNSIKYYTIYNSSFYAKMITAIHIDASKTDDGIEIEPNIEPVLYTPEVHDINVMEHCAFLLASTSDITPNDDYANDYGYIRNQIKQSGIGIWKYWSGLALMDSLSYFGVNQESSSTFVNSAKNENYFIYMLNMYISYKIKSFEYALIDKEFSEVEKIKLIKEKMQRLKNEYSSKEIAKRFQQNEINIIIQKGMGYLDVYDEVESNIDKTLSLTKDRFTEVLSFIGIALFFQDWIKNTFNAYILDNILMKYFLSLKLYDKTFILFFLIVVILNLIIANNIYKKVGAFLINLKRKIM